MPAASPHPSPGTFSMHERYEWILAQVNDWLKFAEAKNGALVVFNSTVLIASVQMVAERLPDHPAGHLYLGSLWVFVGAGLVIALFSFLPSTAIPLLGAGERRAERDNLLFFGDIKKYAPADLMDAIRARYAFETPPDARWERDVCEQIVINARITTWKYTCFRVAMWATLYGLLTPVLGAFVGGILYLWNKAHRI